MINVSTFRIKNRSFEFLPGVCIKLNSPLGHKGSLVVHTRCAQAIRQFLVELGRRVVNHRDDAHVLCGALHARQLNSADTVHTALKPRLAYKYSAAVLQYRAELSFRCRFYRAFFFSSFRPTFVRSSLFEYNKKYQQFFKHRFIDRNFSSLQHLSLKNYYYYYYWNLINCGIKFYYWPRYFRYNYQTVNIFTFKIKLVLNWNWKKIYIIALSVLFFSAYTNIE